MVTVLIKMTVMHARGGKLEHGSDPELDIPADNFSLALPFPSLSFSLDVRNDTLFKLIYDPCRMLILYRESLTTLLPSSMGGRNVSDVCKEKSRRIN